MRAARLHGVGDLRLADEPEPAAGPGEELVRVTAVGICGSDLHWWDEAGIGDAVITRPLVLGHEAAGVIEAGPRRGTRVAIDPAITCGRCRPCLDGYRNLCLNIRFAGHGDQDGAMREFLAWPSDLLHPLPDSVTDTDGALLEPLGVAIHALDLGHVRLGARVAVAGCGPIGLLLIAVLRAAGASHIAAFEPLPHRREAALRYGADVCLRPDILPGDLRELVGEGAEVVFEMAGTSGAVTLSMAAVRSTAMSSSPIGPHPTTATRAPSRTCPRSRAWMATPSGSSSAPSVSVTLSGSGCSRSDGQASSSRMAPSWSPCPANRMLRHRLR